MSSVWDAGRLGDVCRVVPGYAFRSSDWQTDGIPVVKIKNLTGNNTVDLATADCVPESLLTSRLQKFVLEDGDILVAMTGATAGKVGKVRTKRPLLLNQRVAKIVPVEADPDFIWAVVSSQEYQDRFFSLADGAAQPNMSGGQIEGVEVPLPPLPIQRRIAGILSAYDELIENNQRRIKILEAMARALYREWFVHFRFPEHSDNEFVQLETGPAPKSWQSGPLHTFLDVLETGNRPKGGVGEIYEGVPSIGAESIVGIGQFDFSKTKYVPRDYFESMRSGVLQDRDVLLYKDGGRPGIFIPHVSLFGSGFPFEEMAINSHVYRLRAKSGISQEYLHFYLSSESVLHWMHMHGSGAAIPSLARDDLRTLPFVRPSADALAAFDTVVQPLVSQILCLARQSQNLRRTRDLLLPRLLSGELALPDVTP